MGIHVEGEAGQSPHLAPIQPHKKRSQSVRHSSRSGRSPRGSPNRNLEAGGREESELQIELSASRICRSTGAKTNVAVTHIPNESHRLGAPIALPFAFIRTNLCKLTFPVTRGASTQSAPAKSTNLVSATAAAAFSSPSPAARTALCAMCTEKGGERRGQQGP